MAGYHDLEAGRCRLEIESREIVQHVDGNASELDDLSFRQLARPCSLVDIAANSGHRRDGGEFLQNL